MAARGAASVTMWVTSGRRSAAFSGTTTSPIRRQATCAATKSAPDGAHSTTLSPRRRPAA